MEKRRRRQAQFAQPQTQDGVAQRIGKIQPVTPAQLRRSAAQARQFGSRFGVDVIGGRARPRRAVRQRDRRIRPTLGQPRQDFMTKEIAAQARIGVARIVAPDQRVLARVVGERIARQLEQWTPQESRAERTHRAHAAETFRTGATQQFQQDRLGLIVGVVRQRDHFAGDA